MKKTSKRTKCKKPPNRDSFVTAQQASATLNLPLYYFINTAKRSQLGVPHYFINRMVRYRLGELRQWYVTLAKHMAQTPQQAVQAMGAVEGGVDA